MALKTITHELTVRTKELVSPHIDVTFIRTNGGDIKLRFGVGSEVSFAQALRMGQKITMTLERDDEGN